VITHETLTRVPSSLLWAQTCPAIHSTQFPHQDQFSCSKHDSLYSPWP
jgi:hypothetical protein